MLYMTLVVESRSSAAEVPERANEGSHCMSFLASRLVASLGFGTPVVEITRVCIAANCADDYICTCLANLTAWIGDQSDSRR